MSTVVVGLFLVLGLLFAGFVGFSAVMLQYFASHQPSRTDEQLEPGAVESHFDAEFLREVGIRPG